MTCTVCVEQACSGPRLRTHTFLLRPPTIAGPVQVAMHLRGRLCFTCAVCTCAPLFYAHIHRLSSAIRIPSCQIYASASTGCHLHLLLAESAQPFWGLTYRRLSSVGRVEQVLLPISDTSRASSFRYRSAYDAHNQKHTCEGVYVLAMHTYEPSSFFSSQPCCLLLLLTRFTKLLPRWRTTSSMALASS